MIRIFCLTQDAGIEDGQTVSVEDILENGDWSGEAAAVTKQLSRTTTRPSIVGVTGLRNLGKNQNPSSPPSCELAALAATGPRTGMDQPLPFGGCPSMFCVA